MANSAHTIYYKPGGFEDLHSGCTDLQLRDLGLNQNQVDTILRELVASGFDGACEIGGTNATPSAYGLASIATIAGRGGSVSYA